MTIDRIGAFEEGNRIAVDVWELDENECVAMLQPSTLTAEAREHVSLLFYRECDVQSLPPDYRLAKTVAPL